MSEAIRENRELLKRHAEKDLPTSDLAKALLETVEAED